MAHDSVSTSVASHVQSRFVRQNMDSSQLLTKPRFLSRNKATFPLYCADRILTSLSIRRTKRTRLCLALSVFALIASAFIVAIFQFNYSFSFTKFTTTDSFITSFNTSYPSFIVHGIQEQHPPLSQSAIEDANAPLDADQPDLQHRDDSNEPAEHFDAQPGQGQPTDLRPHPETVRKPSINAESHVNTDDVVEQEVDSAKDLPTAGDESSMDTIRKKYDSAPMSIVVLFHNEYGSLKNALTSWIEKGLVDYVQEVLIFLNGVPSEEDFQKNMPLFEERIPESKRRVFLSKDNLPLGLAITKMVELAKSEYILLLEKDWELIEPQDVMRSRLIDSKVVVGTGVAHLVRHRHRNDPGAPLHARIMHQGREETIIRDQKNLLCFVHHWQGDPTIVYPGRGIMYRCGGTQRNVEEEDLFCSSSEYCQWNNNPGVFKRKWFIDEVGNRFKKEYEIELKMHGSRSPFLDFEYYTNWRSYAWTDKNITVAVGMGLFRHAETEHLHFNTFWYAHFRLEQDLKEIRDTYLKNETTFKKLGGVHSLPGESAPASMMERYPVGFVRKYHFKDMFIGTLETQRTRIQDQYQKFQSVHRILTEEEWQTTGLESKKAKDPVDWRREITSLHEVVERAMMIAPPKQPHEMNITLVTCLLDLGRDELAEDGYEFRRDFQMYLDAMQDWLTHEYAKVVYTSKKISTELLKHMSEESKETTRFVDTSREELRTRWLGPDNYAKVQRIRNSSEWRSRADWLRNSPQAALEDYNPLVMSKMFMVRDAARENYWNTSHFVFLDSKHNCRQPKVMTPKNDHILRAHMFDHFLLTTFEYTPANEVHGFEYSAFNSFCNQKSPSERQLLKIGRGGIFGGSEFVVEYMSAMYDVALTATLNQGVMGTEENILSILKYQVPQYVDDFSNNWACADNVENDHKCSSKTSQGYNCAIFEWMARDAVKGRA